MHVISSVQPSRCQNQSHVLIIEGAHARAPGTFVPNKEVRGSAWLAADWDVSVAFANDSRGRPSGSCLRLFAFRGL
jgi:hypothetical protein